MKIDLKDTTFIIPLRLDSIIRLENLLLAIEYLVNSFQTNILLLEASSYKNNLIPSLLKDKVQYWFVEDGDPIFYRTKYLNMMADNVKSPYLAIWDADVIIDKMQIIKSVQKLRIGMADVAFPYDGKFYDTSYIIREHYMLYKDIAFFKRNESKMELIYGSEMVGGAIIVNKEKYIYAGKENLSFYGWGPEDTERFHRWQVFNYKIYRSEGSLYHLTHPRDINGKSRSEDHFDDLNNIATSIANSTVKEILYNFNK
jgi:predicted glycosyltransferase involved in capsule biosynthesis